MDNYVYEYLVLQTNTWKRMAKFSFSMMMTLTSSRKSSPWGQMAMKSISDG
jgi:hypothetical protein